MKYKHPPLIETDFGGVYIERHDQLGEIVHCIVEEWTPTNYKTCKFIWNKLMHKWKELGIKRVYAGRKLEDEKLKKFAEKFGFEDTEMATQDHDGNFLRIMECNTNV